MTSDYDVWIHFDDVEKLNAAFAPLEHYPNYAPAEARKRGRYVLENGQRVNVLLARAATAPTQAGLTFDEAWDAKQVVRIDDNLEAHLPSIEHLIITKRWGSRPRDLVDIDWLAVLQSTKS